MELTEIKGLGEKNLKKLNTKNIYTIDDLLTYYPINYNIYSNSNASEFIETSSNTIVTGVITKNITEYKPRSNLLITNYFVSTGAQEIKIIAFNQRHLRFTIKKGDKIEVFGKYDNSKNQLTQKNFKILKEEETANLNLDKIYPIYSKISGISDLQLKKTIIKAIETLEESTYKTNLLKIHNPQTQRDINESKNFLKYKEFYNYYQKLNDLKNVQEVKKKEFIKNISQQDFHTLINKLPFSLTEDQDKVLKNLVNSLNDTLKTQTLILGDVGSGKTIIAIILTYMLVKKGFQVAVMAPTEVLAKQLYQNFNNFLPELKSATCLLTSSIKKQERNQIKDRILLGIEQIIVGTHSIIQEDVIFKNLAICIIDEQHRFGVEQRNKLIQKTNYGEYIYLSATPIPRTLAQSMFGVMKVEFIEQKPKNRKNIITNIYTKKNKKDIFQILDEELKKSNQVYIVAPTIERTEIKGLENVETLYNNFSNYYKNKYNVGIIHGSLKSKDKESIMEKFRNKYYDILVATTVIEVGVDIKDATVILIINAERFGLATLHQLRGRIGRSNKQSYCLLYDKSNNELSKERLKLLKKYDNGFILANKDLTMRGYGNFFGKEQSGFSDFKLFNYSEDFEIAQQVIKDFGNKNK